MLYVIANDYDEALDNIEVDEAIIEAANTGSFTIDFEYGYERIYEYSGGEDSEWVTLGCGEVDLEDLDIGVDELFYFIKSRCL